MRTLVIDHPLVAHKLTRLRREETSSATFRLLAEELVTLLAYEATRALVVHPVEIRTPVAPCTGVELADPRPIVVPILRAGLGMLNGMTKLMPTAEVGFLGMVRDEQSLLATTYADRLPHDLQDRQVFVLDPMLATGGTLIAFTSEFLMEPYVCAGLDHRALLYWRKTNPAPNFRKQIVRAVEMAVWQTQGGNWTFNGSGYRPNVWEGPILSGYTVQNTGEARVHPTQKPLWLMREWIELFTKPGDIILDPFMGSGTTLRAAKDLGRRAIGIEIDERFCRAAIERMRQSVLALHGTEVTA